MPDIHFLVKVHWKLKNWTYNNYHKYFSKKALNKVANITFMNNLVIFFFQSINFSLDKPIKLWNNKLKPTDALSSIYNLILAYILYYNLQSTNLQSTNCGNYTGTSVTFPQSCCPLQSEFTLVLTVPNCLDNSLNNLNHRTLLQYKFVHCVLCYDIQDQYYVMQSQLRLMRRS